MGTEIERIEAQAIVRQPDELSVEAMVAQVQKIQQAMKAIMEDGVHFGTIPGTPKPTLYKPGAEKLCLMFRLDPQYQVDRTFSPDGHLDVLVTCTLYHITSGNRVASGVGSCSTRESKYAYRTAGRTCPSCGMEGAIIKGKDEYGGGWLCFKKKNGCGAKFAVGDKSIEDQAAGRVANDELADVHNTIVKMACKRALIAGVLNATAASDIFTQDIEDMPGVGRAVEPAAPAKVETVDPLVAARAQSIQQLFAKKFGRHEREVVLATISRDLGRDVSSSKDLTKADHDKICAAWNMLNDGTGQIPETAAPVPSAAPHEAKAPAAAADGGAASDNGLPFDDQPESLSARILNAARTAKRTSDEHRGRVQVDAAMVAAFGVTGGWRFPSELVEAGIGEQVLTYYTQLADAAEGVKS